MTKILYSFFVVGFICLTTVFLNAQSTIHSENFNTITSVTWTAQSVIGSNDVWGFTGGFALVNGFNTGGTEADGGPDEDWLISPSINLDNALTNTISFKYAERFTGPDIQLLYSTNYVSGLPSTATWTPLISTLEYTSNTAALGAFQNYTSNTLLAGLNGSIVFAFKYTTTGTANAGNAEEWAIDDILIQSQTPPICSPPLTQATSLSTSPSNLNATISWAKGDGSNSLVLINNMNSFTDPLDGTAYAANTTYAGSGQQTAYVSTGNSVSVSGLTANTTYHVRIYNFQTCASPIDYVTASPLSGSFTTTNFSGTGLPDGLSCTDARAWIKTNYYTGKHSSLGYDNARRRMYGNCDNQSGTVTCVYGGYVAAHPLNSNLTSITIPGGIINAEHTVPQSFFDQIPILRSDMHHLFPTVDDWNNHRGTLPFAEIPDNLTNQWETGLNTTSSTIPTSNINDYSEWRTNVNYEPREIQKGNTARAILYFYTMYESEMNGYSKPITTVASLQTLINWHNQDPPTAADITRNTCIESNQGNRNPYIDNPSWVAKAFFGSTDGCLAPPLPIDLIYFDGKNKDDYNQLSWRTASEKNTANHVVERKEVNDWKTIGQVKAAGNSIEPMNYSFNDLEPKPLSIYRLKTVDLDGSENLSKMITISRTEKSFILKMFPNPAKDFVTFRTNTTENQAFNVTITDISGRTLIQKSYDITSGGLDNHINISALSNGIYFFTFDNGIRKTTERFVRQ